MNTVSTALILYQLHKDLQLVTEKPAIKANIQRDTQKIISDLTYSIWRVIEFAAVGAWRINWYFSARSKYRCKLYVQFLTAVFGQQQVAYTAFI